MSTTAGGTPGRQAGGTPSKHEWLRQRLQEVVAGLEPHTPLPTEREIATQHGVSRQTVRRALDALEDAGSIYRVHGSGTYTAGPMISKTLTMTSFSEDMTARGLVPSSRLLAAEAMPAGDRIGEQLAIPGEESVVRLARLRLADNRPMCLETTYLPEARVPELLEQDDLERSLYALLHSAYGFRLTRAEQIVTGAVLTGTEAALLRAPENTPALRVHRIGLDDRDCPLEVTESLYRGDRYDLRFTVRREGE
ncbi:GntR family transcriptional regulator [Streptomyces armeniacus]|uniref:GntR family transcriptional regulator n=1 Tax=Streptomyces armeniacus TaxID=83291 RepID=A0A345Y0Q9_9ACTN|nr:GntR family transcriptional regulator [Streptomyces armeniacus]AXK37475.1 GntR family transcriptional regulator [Streptomyces armeniacus]